MKSKNLKRYQAIERRMRKYRGENKETIPTNIQTILVNTLNNLDMNSANRLKAEYPVLQKIV